VIPKTVALKDDVRILLLLHLMSNRHPDHFGELADIGSGIFVYFSRSVRDLLSRAVEDNEHICFGIATITKFGDARVFLITEAFDGGIDFVEER